MVKRGEEGKGGEREKINDSIPQWHNDGREGKGGRGGTGTRE